MTAILSSNNQLFGTANFAVEEAFMQLTKYTTNHYFKCMNLWYMSLKAPKLQV